jgi:hypothetical protein
MSGHVAHVNEIRNAYRILVGKPCRKIPLWRPNNRCVNNIKVNFKGLGSTASGHGSVECSYEHGNKPPVSIKRE